MFSFESKGYSVHLTVELRKNGGVIDRVDLPHHRCHIGLVVDQTLLNGSDSSGQSGEKESAAAESGESIHDSIAAEVIASCPTYPTVTADHFPLGASLLYRSKGASQWTLGQVTFPSAFMDFLNLFLRVIRIYLNVQGVILFF